MVLCVIVLVEVYLLSDWFHMSISPRFAKVDRAESQVVERRRNHLERWGLAVCLGGTAEKNFQGHSLSSCLLEHFHSTKTRWIRNHCGERDGCNIWCNFFWVVESTAISNISQLLASWCFIIHMIISIIILISCHSMFPRMPIYDWTQ